MVVGRRSTPPGVPDVETLACPASTALGPHRIMADPHKVNARGPARDNPVWACAWCHVTWAELDEQLRAAQRAGTPPRIASPA